VSCIIAVRKNKEPFENEVTVEETPLEFEERSRSIKFREKHRVCEKGSYETYGYIRGNQIYSDGIHHIRIKIERME